MCAVPFVSGLGAPGVFCYGSGLDEAVFQGTKVDPTKRRRSIGQSIRVGLSHRIK